MSAAGYGCRAQRRHGSSGFAPVAVGVLVLLGVTDPVPALNVTKAKTNASKHKAISHERMLNSDR
jgi:hypothetical protein